MVFHTDIPPEPACIKPDSLSLSDCLACSGCLTAGESSEFSPNTSFLKYPQTPLSFIISPHSKMSLYSCYSSVSFEDFEMSLLHYLRRRFNTKHILDTSWFCKEGKSGISSECPAVVLHIERQFPELLPQLSTHKTYQEMAAEYLQQIPGHTGVGVVSVMQCYDKKDESRRDGTTIDYFLGTRDLYEIIRHDFEPSSNSGYQPAAGECMCVTGYPEVCGKAACIRFLNKAKNGLISPIELRMCSGGCARGPAQLLSQIPEIQIIKQPEFSHYKSISERSFSVRPKRSFAVEW